MGFLPDNSSPQTIGQLVGQAADFLAGRDIETPKIDARHLMAYVLQKPASGLTIFYNESMQDSEIKEFCRVVDLRAQHCPVSRIIGSRGFWTFDSLVNTCVLDPRPDTETLVMAAQGHAQKTALEPARILDLGTGSGCLLLALLDVFKTAKGAGIDISKKAVEVACKNAKHNNLQSRTDFFVDDWFSGLRKTKEKFGLNAFDIVVSNPPYITESDWHNLADEVKNFDPKTALTAGADGLDSYRKLATVVPALLHPNGFVVIESGKGQASDIVKLFTHKGLQWVGTQKDYGGVERAVVFSATG